MASKVQICNLALSRIRDTRITSLSDGTAEALALNNLYDEVAKNVMAHGAWTGCVYRASLAKTTNTPEYEYTNEFQLPVSPKLLKLISINEQRPGDIAHAIERDKLLTDIDAVKIKYIGFQEDPEEYGPFLQQAIVSRLAAELAYPMTGNMQLSARLEAKAEEDLLNGIALDNQQGSKDYYRASTLIDVRHEYGAIDPFSN